MRKKILLWIFSLVTLSFVLYPVGYARTFSWSEESLWGTKVGISLITEESWTTGNTYQIEFSFTCQDIDTDTFYDNSHIKLAKVELRISYVYERTESPFENITEGNTWTANWSFAPEAKDFTVNRDESKSFTVYLDVSYYVVEMDGTEHSEIFYNSDVSIKVIGGPDASKPGDGPGIPGFPLESLLVGLVIGFATLMLLRKRRMTLPSS